PDCTWVKSRMRTPSSALPAWPHAFALGAGQRSPFVFAAALAALFWTGLTTALRLTGTFFTAALVFTLLLFQCLDIVQTFSLVHRLVLGAGRVFVGITPNIDHRRFTGLGDLLSRLTQRWCDLRSLTHLLAPAAPHLREYREVHVAEFVADVAALGTILRD